MQAPPFPGRTVHENPITGAAAAAPRVRETSSFAIGTARGVLDLFEESIRYAKTIRAPLVAMTDARAVPAVLRRGAAGHRGRRGGAPADERRLHGRGRGAPTRRTATSTQTSTAASSCGCSSARRWPTTRVLLMMRVNGSAGMRTGAMWQRYLRDMNVLMTHNTVQPKLVPTSTAACTSGSCPTAPRRSCRSSADREGYPCPRQHNGDGARHQSRGMRVRRRRRRAVALVGLPRRTRRSACSRRTAGSPGRSTRSWRPPTA